MTESYQKPETLTDDELLRLWRQAKSLFTVLDHIVRDRGLVKCPVCERRHLGTVSCTGQHVDAARHTR